LEEARPLSICPNPRHFSDFHDLPHRSVQDDESIDGQLAAGARRILIVEDEFILALGMEVMVQEFGYIVCDVAATTAAAVAAAAEHRPDVVLMDIRLARGSDGVEAATLIRDRFGIRSIFITAYTDSATIARMRGAEPIGWLSKPCDPAQLAALIRGAFEGRD